MDAKEGPGKASFGVFGRQRLCDPRRPFLVWHTWWCCALIGLTLMAMETQPWVNDTPSEYVSGKRQRERTAHIRLHKHTPKVIALETK